jgi:hypothetical protein
MDKNDLYTFTLCTADWERVMGALRALSVQHIQAAHEAGAESTYAAVLFDEAGIMQAIASDIDFMLPE